MLEEFTAALKGSLQKVEPTSTSCNDCGIKKVARHVYFRVCYTGHFSCNLYRTPNIARQVARKIAKCNSAFTLACCGFALLHSIWLKKTSCTTFSTNQKLDQNQ